jgi:UDP-N-acetyl-D-mannosaminuronic acid dehydrogenase
LEGRLSATTDAIKASKDSDVKIILVPTLIKKNKPDLSPVYAVAKNIAKGLNKGDIVITECTMPPGSTESLIPILEKGSGLKAGRDFGLGHCPERTMTGTAIADITGKYPKIVGAIDDKTRDALVGIYSVINAKGVIPSSGIKAAELVKVFEGVYRDANIALANELERVCRSLGVDYMEIQSAANTQPYSHLHVPGGVGGHCIPYYPYFVMNKNTVLMKTGRQVNDSMPSYIIRLARDALKEEHRPLKKANVLVLGIAFRGGVKETIKSTSLELIEGLKPLAGKVYAYDPLFSKEEIGRYAPYKDDFAGIDCIILMADHKQFRDYDWKKIAGTVRTKVLVDSRQFFAPKEIREKGFNYRGVGFV